VAPEENCSGGQTPPSATVVVPEEGEYYSDAWAEAHRVFHRTLLDGCGNPVLLETFDRLWTASELARRLSALRAPGRDAVGEHAGLGAREKSS
jgi:DNA-binding GntR family transcriptional regulator